ncbi:MAG TPA: pyridoxamine 5'-phosphate oxidase family protein [Pseudonocardia sp.]|nr:pyridoxamine 5'-phosphate oxidase family protein [Pseudonocardia sp.]
MDDLARVAPAFVGMAHRIVWATLATVDPRGRPWTRVVHPIWEFDGARLVGWVASFDTPLKRAHLAACPDVSLTYWDPGQDTATAQCRARLHTDDATRAAVWERFAGAPAPVGYDPAVLPQWSGGPTSPAFSALRLDPWRLRVQPAGISSEDDVLRWVAGAGA